MQKILFLNEKINIEYIKSINEIDYINWNQISKIKDIN